MTNAKNAIALTGNTQEITDLTGQQGGFVRGHLTAIIADQMFLNNNRVTELFSETASTDNNPSVVYVNYDATTPQQIAETITTRQEDTDVVLVMDALATVGTERETFRALRLLAQDKNVSVVVAVARDVYTLQLPQEVDLELFVEGATDTLSIKRGKHRIATKTPEENLSVDIAV